MVADARDALIKAGKEAPSEKELLTRMSEEREKLFPPESNLGGGGFF